MVTQWVWVKGNGVELLELRWCYWFLALIVVVWMQEKLKLQIGSGSARSLVSR